MTVAYFVRKVLFGVLAFFASTLAFYGLFQIPTSYPGYLDSDACDGQVHQYAYFGSLVTYAMDKPWPMNYLTWLYNPKSEIKTFLLPAERCMVGTRPARSVSFQNRGLLMGDFGKSLWLEPLGKSDWLQPGSDVLNAYGIELGPLYSMFCGTLLLSMAVALLQRRGRRTTGRSSRIPPDARWRLATLTFPG